MVHFKEVSYFVEELTCKFCVRRVLDGLRSIDGVIAVRVSSAPLLDDLADASGYGIATVKYNPDFTGVTPLKEFMEVRLGFTVREVHEENHPIRQP